MIRRVALVSGLVVLGAMSVASKASAQAVPLDVNFGGTVNAKCVFTPVNDGVLGIGPSDNTLVTGTKAKVTLDCNLPTIVVRVEQPVQGTPALNPGASQFDLAGAKVSVTSDGTTANAENSHNQITVERGVRTLEVGMSASTNDGLPVAQGDYSFKVKVTAGLN